MRRRFSRRKKNSKFCVVATLILPILLIMIGSTVSAELLMSVKLTAITIAESGDPVIEMSGWRIVSTNTFDANGNGIVVGDELIIESVVDGAGEVVELAINVDPIFPDWYLDFETDIHNMGNSIPVHLSRMIYYVDSEGNQVLTDEAYLLTLYSMRYSDSWYDKATGNVIPDITTCDIWPCNTVVHVEHLTFEGQERPELQDQTFSIIVEVTATYPGG